MGVIGAIAATGWLIGSASADWLRRTARRERRHDPRHGGRRARRAADPVRARRATRRSRSSPLSGMLGGFGAVVYNIQQVSLRQAITPERLQGRMNASMRFFVWGTIPLGSLVGGVLATAFGVRTAILVGACLGFVSLLPILLSPLRTAARVPGAGRGPAPARAGSHGRPRRRRRLARYRQRMPELPEMEAWRRQLNDPVSAFPIAKAGPAHIATLKTFDPPLDALEGRRFRGAERRGKRLLFPTDDGELVAPRPPDDRGTAQVPRGRRERPEDAGVRARVPGRLEARPDREREEEARRRLAAHAGGRRGRARAPRPGGARARDGAARRDRPRRVTAAARAAARPAADRRASAARGRTRSSIRRSSPPTRSRATSTTRRWRGSQPRSTPSSSAGSSCARRAPPTRRPTASTGGSASRATSAGRRSRRSTSRSTRSSTARRCQTGGRVLKDRRLSRLLR